MQHVFIHRHKGAQEMAYSVEIHHHFFFSPSGLDPAIWGQVRCFGSVRSQGTSSKKFRRENVFGWGKGT